jgi:hypothetical protein
MQGLPFRFDSFQHSAIREIQDDIYNLAHVLLILSVMMGNADLRHGVPEQKISQVVLYHLEDKSNHFIKTDISVTQNKSRTVD